MQVKDRELPQIRKAFSEAAKIVGLAKCPSLKLTAIIVAKRHHVRFFPGTDDPDYAKLNGRRETNGNCLPGTLVDAAVTSSYFQDFYLQSHDGLKGTAKAAHYFTLVNEIDFSEKELQEFVSDYAVALLRRVLLAMRATDILMKTHKLCYTYVRATMGVSYAPPAYYADRLCERGRYVPTLLYEWISQTNVSTDATFAISWLPFQILILSTATRRW